MAATAGGRGGELGVFRVLEHPVSTQVHPLIAKSTPSKLNEKFLHKTPCNTKIQQKYYYFSFNLGK